MKLEGRAQTPQLGLTLPKRFKDWPDLHRLGNEIPSEPAINFFVQVIDSPFLIIERDRRQGA